MSVLLRSLIVAALAALPVNPTIAASDQTALDEVAAQFEAVVFGREYGYGDDRLVVRKWTSRPVFAFFTAPGFDLEPHLRTIVDQAKRIGDLTDLSAGVTRNADKANLRFGFYPREDFAKLRGDKNDPEFQRFVQESACISISKLADESKGTIASGTIMVGTDIDEAMRRHCIVEEMVQMMGLPNDACHYRPSLFCEEDFVNSLTRRDIILLDVLYDDRLTPGMAQEDALPLARKLIGERLNEGAPVAH